MSVASVLFLILFALMALIGGERGAISFFSLCFNFITFILMLEFMALRVDPIKVTVIGCIIISSITLFFTNGLNKKTVSSLISVLIVLILTLLITSKVGTDAKIQGFGREQAESIYYLLPNAQFNFTKILISEVMFGLLGAIIDVSISISSSMNEIYQNNLLISKESLFKSGINIGKDILGTMTNTLLFAYIAGFMTLLIWFNKFNYSISDILNAKVFGSEVFQILCSGIGIILIIPVTAFITAMVVYLRPQTRELR